MTGMMHAVGKRSRGVCPPGWPQVPVMKTPKEQGDLPAAGARVVGLRGGGLPSGSVKWTPPTANVGAAFGAAGFLLALSLHAKLGVPIGVIQVLRRDS